MIRSYSAECPMKPTTSRSALSALTRSTMAAAAWPATTSACSFTPLAFATLRASSSTSWNLWFSASLVSSTSSIEAGKSGSSSTEIMCSVARCSLARSQANSSALRPPSDPSLATAMRLNMSDLLLHRADLWQEPPLRDHRRHHRARNHRDEQDRLLPLVDDVVGQTRERGDRSERQARRHQERGVHALAVLEPIVARQRQDADEFGRHLQREKQYDQPGTSDERGSVDQRACLEEVERREHREGNDPHAVRQFGITLEGGGECHADDVRRQHGFAADGCRKAAEPERDEQQKLDLGLAHPATELGEEPGCHLGHEPADHHGGGGKGEQPDRERGKRDAERKNGAEIGDEAGGEDDLAELSLVEAGLDHYRIDHGDRGGGERDAGDLRLRPVPAEQVARGQHAAEIGQQKTHQPYTDTGPEVASHDLHVDLGAGQEGQQDGAEAREIIDPRRQWQADGIAGNRTDNDLDQRDRQRQPDRDQRRDQRESNPQRRDEPNVVNHRSRSLCCLVRRGAKQTVAESGLVQAIKSRLARHALLPSTFGRSHQPSRAVSGDSIPTAATYSCGSTCGQWYGCSVLSQSAGRAYSLPTQR